MTRTELALNCALAMLVALLFGLMVNSITAGVAAVETTEVELRQ